MIKTVIPAKAGIYIKGLSLKLYKKSILGLLLTVVLVSGFYFFTLPSPAPTLSLPLIDGRTLTLASLKGRPVLVYFWASTCALCLEELPQLVKLYQEFAPQGLEIIGIGMFYDPPNRILYIAKAFQIPYPIALDVQAQAAKAFGNISVTPTHFLINPQGKIVHQQMGKFDDQRVRQYLADFSITPNY